MKIIIVISPNYLEAVYKDSQKYSFVIQGYGNFAAARVGIMYTNASDILGCIYLGSSFPTKLDDALAFFNSLNLMCKPLKVILASQDKIALTHSQLEKFNNLKFSKLDELEFVTDITINRELFGNILLDNYEPYILKNDSTEKAEVHSDLGLQCKPVIPDILYETVEKVYYMDELQDTYLTDVILNKYKGNDLMQGLRKLVILLRQGYDVSEIVSEIEEIIDKKDDKLYGICKAFISRLIETGGFI